MLPKIVFLHMLLSSSTIALTIRMLNPYRFSLTTARFKERGFLEASPDNGETRYPYYAPYVPQYSSIKSMKSEPSKAYTQSPSETDYSPISTSYDASESYSTDAYETYSATTSYDASETYSTTTSCDASETYSATTSCDAYETYSTATSYDASET